MNNAFSIEVFTGKAASSTVTIVPDRFDLGYYRDRNGNYIVTLSSNLFANPRQQLVALPNHFRKVTGVDHRMDFGLCTVSRDDLTALGFVLREGVTDDASDVYNAAHYA